MAAYPELLDALREQCKKTYRASDMHVDLMAQYVDEHWDEWEANEARGGRDAWHELMVYVWMNFAGGDTAQTVTNKIRETVQKS